MTPALWAFAVSGEWAREIRKIDGSHKLAPQTLLKVPFDRERWQRAAEAAGPLPEPHSDDPTQWLFGGVVPDAEEPLQVAVARLLGYRWPEQLADDLDELADADGIVALPGLAGELDATTRLRGLLARAYGEEWSSTLERRLVTEGGGKDGDLAAWLREVFFSHHCKVFDNLPFLWQIWDGRKDGFSVIVNYHRLDYATLSKITFTTLGAWIDRQQADAAREVPGAESRLLSARDLQRRLCLILDGEAPYDIYVRWKDLREQPIGWHPDIDDGVRLNIRPFATAGALRSKVNVKWTRDSGLNPDGSERHNDLHPRLAEKLAAREAPERSGGAA